MPDDERPEEPQADERGAEEPEGATPGAEEPEAAEPEAEEPREPSVPEATPEDQGDEAGPGAAEPADEEEPAEPSEGKGPPQAPKGDLPPGAELEPITIEPRRELDAEERARIEAEAEERARREAAPTEEAGEEPVARREPRVELASDATIQATGKRKSSIARVVVRTGGGAFTVNERNLEDYFPRSHHQVAARQPLVASGYEGAVDVRVRVHGGGISGQAGAVRHGVARALCEIDPELRGELKRRGLLTRDARRKERRKAGLKKARKRPQFSKR